MKLDKMKFDRIVFERGLELCCSKDGLRYLQSVQGRQFAMAPTEVAKNYKVRPILAMYRLTPDHDHESLFPARVKGMLNIEHSNLSQIAINKDISPIRSFNLDYIIGAVIYHCKRLTKVYSEICRTFAHSPGPKNLKSHQVIFGDQPEPFYELETLITTAIRFYTTTQYIIWHAFGPDDESPPDSFTETLELCKKLPTELKERLRSSWSNYGKKANAYRQCIIHYRPVFNISPYAKMELLQDDVWSTTLWIPDNPQARPYTKFRYSSQIDALTYGWELTDEIVEVASATVNAVPDKKESQVLEEKANSGS